MSKKGSKQTEEHRKKISLALTGRVRSEDHKANLSKSLKGRIGPWLGKHRDPETIRKLNEGREKWQQENPEEFQRVRKLSSRWMVGESNPRFGAKTSAMKGRHHTEESREKMSQSSKGQVAWNKGIKQVKTTGASNPNWKGGVTKESEQLRKSVEYKLWRTSVFERDNYTCLLCKRKKEVTSKLNADHIKPFSLYPLLRFDINNGRTLCLECHKKTESYLNSRMTKDDF